MKNLLIALTLVASLALSSCTRPDVADRVLRDQGYNDVNASGWGFLRCSEDDIFSTRFTAKSAAGVPVRGTVCSGIFKGSTIRVD